MKILFRSIVIIIMPVLIYGCGIFMIGVENTGRTLFTNPDKPQKVEKNLGRSFFHFDTDV